MEVEEEVIGGGGEREEAEEAEEAEGSELEVEVAEGGIDRQMDWRASRYKSELWPRDARRVFGLGRADLGADWRICGEAGLVVEVPLPCPPSYSSSV